MTHGVLVLGQGAVGRRLVRALSAPGGAVTGCDRDGWQEALLGHRGAVLCSLHRGDDSLEVATFLSTHAHHVDVVVDLTTQSTPTVVAAARLAAQRRLGYWAGA